MVKDVVIIGAGASGLMCAIAASGRRRKVLVIDHGDRAGRKIRVSGGGRCNFANSNLSPEHYLSRNPHFLRSALARYTPEDFISLLRKRRIAYHEEDDGKLFCDRTSADVLTMLLAECEKGGVEFLLGCPVRGIARKDLFTVSTGKGEFQAYSLVIATGGLSYPSLGASDFGYRIARQFGLAVTDLRPALVPLTLSDKDTEFLSELRGISFRARVLCGKKAFQGNVLLTHRGLSGPAILQISSYWNKGEALVIDLLPDMDSYGLLNENRRSRKEIHTLLSQFLPGRFIRLWCEQNIKKTRMCMYSDRELREIAASLGSWRVKPAGTEGYKAAEVTLGGIDTDEVSSKTMESKKVPGLYFVGEVLDVTGQLGGYNLHWAWASGHAAGEAV